MDLGKTQVHENKNAPSKMISTNYLKSANIAVNLGGVFFINNYPIIQHYK